MLQIHEVSVYSEEAVELMEELSEVLEKMTGSSGKTSFHPEAVTLPRSVFLVAYEEETPVGCGAFQCYSFGTAEIKRVYSRSKRKGIGHAILLELEKRAKKFGYQQLILETRKLNPGAIHFYLQNGYKVSPNYGKYVGREEAICFQKMI